MAMSEASKHWPKEKAKIARRMKREQKKLENAQSNAEKST